MKTHTHTHAIYEPFACRETVLVNIDINKSIKTTLFNTKTAEQRKVSNLTMPSRAKTAQQAKQAAQASAGNTDREAAVKLIACFCANKVKWKIVAGRDKFFHQVARFILHTYININEVVADLMILPIYLLPIYTYIIELVYAAWKRWSCSQPGNKSVPSGETWRLALV